MTEFYLYKVYIKTALTAYIMSKIITNEANKTKLIKQKQHVAFDTMRAEFWGEVSITCTFLRPYGINYAKFRKTKHETKHV